jgi:hypothetical protein
VTADAASPDTPSVPAVVQRAVEDASRVVVNVLLSRLGRFPGIEAVTADVVTKLATAGLLSLSGDSTREGSGSLRSEASGAPVKTPRLRRPGSPWTVRVHTWTDGEQTPTHSFSNRSVSADTEHHRGHLFPNAEFDELVVGRWLHVEQMDNCTWWMNVGGVTVHVTADRDGRPTKVVVHGPGDYDEPREGCEYSLTWTATPTETREVPRP